MNGEAQSQTTLKPDPCPCNDPNCRQRKEHEAWIRVQKESASFPAKFEDIADLYGWES